MESVLGPECLSTGREVVSTCGGMQQSGWSSRVENMVMFDFEMGPPKGKTREP